MNEIEIINTCKALENKLRNRNYIRPEVSANLNWIGSDINVTLKWRISDIDVKHEFFYGKLDQDSVFSVLAKADKFIEEMGSIEDSQKAEFIKSVGKLIDMGREINIDVAFINPLTEVMKNLSKNIITHKEI